MNKRKTKNVSKLHLTKVAKCVAIMSAALISTQTIAQEENESIVLEEFIVIGTPGGKGVNRLDASFAVSTFNDEQIEKIQPKSTADFLKNVPGIWAESSGGVSGANIDVRGLPGGSDAPYTTFALNGSPIYGFNFLSFFEGSTLFRIDDTIEAVEVVRGGPSAVFSKGEPGATVNFRIREGGPETEARVKYTTSDYDLQRIDAVMSGELSDNLFYTIGGYVKSSPGIRDAQFNSEEGTQFTAQLTKILDNGKVNVYTRITDDHGQFYLPISLNNTGLDLGTFSQLGNATRFRTLQVNANGDTETFDFADGRGWKGAVTGANFEFDLGGGWTLRDNVSFTKGDADTFALFPSGSAVSVSALEAVIGGPVTTQSGLTLGADQFAQTYGHWAVRKELQNFANDLSINKELESGHNVTVGYYSSTFSADDFWTIGNPIPVHNTQNGDILNSAITPADIAAAGGNAGFMFGLEGSGDAQVRALYLADTWQATDRLIVDAAFRLEEIDIEYLLDTGPGYPDSVTDMNVSIDGDETAYSFGVNYSLSDTLSFYGRYSEGFTWPNFDSIRNGSQTVQEIQQLEGGMKFANDWLSAYATLFTTETDSFASVVGGVIPSGAFVTDSVGVELEATVVLADSFQINFGTTLQNAEIKSSTNGNAGNQVLRQPEWQVRVAPEYSFNIGSVEATAYGNVFFIGDRFGDNANTVDLEGYEKVDLGVIVNYDSGLFFQIHADNLTDSDGITEGDPRNPSAPNGRPILGRSVKLSIGYDF